MFVRRFAWKKLSVGCPTMLLVGLCSSHVHLLRGMPIHRGALTMRGGNDGVDVSEKEESSNERVDPLGLCFRKLLLDQRTCGLA